MCPLLPPPPPALPLSTAAAAAAAPSVYGGVQRVLKRLLCVGGGHQSALAPVWDGPPLEPVSYLSKSTTKACCYCGRLPSTMRCVTLQGKEAARGGPPSSARATLVTPALFALRQAISCKYNSLRNITKRCIQFAYNMRCATTAAAAACRLCRCSPPSRGCRD